MRLNIIIFLFIIFLAINIHAEIQGSIPCMHSSSGVEVLLYGCPNSNCNEISESNLLSSQITDDTKQVTLTFSGYDKYAIFNYLSCNQVQMGVLPLPTGQIPPALPFAPFPPLDCKEQTIVLDSSDFKVDTSKTLLIYVGDSFQKNYMSTSSYIPPNYEEYYLADTEVQVTITKPDGSTLNLGTKPIKIPNQGENTTSFQWEPTLEGLHTITVTATVTDCQCSSPTTKTETFEVTVSPPDATCSIDNQCVIGCINGDQDCGCQQQNAYLCQSTELCPGRILAHNQSQSNTCCSQPCVPQGSLECVESSTRTCGTNAGICTVGIETCQSGMWRNCTATDPEPKDCNSILDNDCNGEIDEQEAYCKLLKQNQTTVIITQNTNNTTPIIQGPDPFCGDRIINGDETCLNCIDAICLATESCQLGECTPKPTFGWLILIVLTTMVILLGYFIYRYSNTNKKYMNLIFYALVILTTILLYTQISNFVEVQITGVQSTSTLILEDHVESSLKALFTKPDLELTPSEYKFIACLDGIPAKKAYQFNKIDESKNGCSAIKDIATVYGIKDPNQCYVPVEAKTTIVGIMCEPNKIEFYHQEDLDNPMFYVTRDIEEPTASANIIEKIIQLMHSSLSIIVALTALTGLYLKYKKKHNKLTKQDAPEPQYKNLTLQEQKVLKALSRAKYGLYRKFIANNTGLSETEINQALQNLKQKDLIDIHEEFGYEKVKKK